LLEPGFKVCLAMPNRAIEIHDSTLANVAVSQGRAELTFSSVYIHQSDGRPGIDAGSGWVQEAILRITDADAKGAFSQLPVNLDGGYIRLGEQLLDNVIPIPLRHTGPIELRLEAWPQAQEVVTISGGGAELELVGEPEYVEKFRP
jgi:hypothetical protein